MAAAEKVVQAGAGVRAVGRALEILLAFTSKDVELTAAELLKRVRLSRPTLYRLLYTLEKTGFVVALGEPQRFRLGPAVGKLADIWSSSLDVSAAADPIMKRLWTETEETVAVFVPQGPLRLCIAELPSPQVISFKRGVGYTELLARGASGRAMLAFMDLAPDELPVFLRGTDLDPKEFARELARTRKRGYATSHNELIRGAVAIAAPFFYRSGRLAGSLGLFGPEVRLDKVRLEKLGTLVQKHARELSKALGAGT